MNSVRTAVTPRIYLSPPHIGADERRHVAEAFDSNWVAPVGPHLAAFEAEMCAATGIRSALCVSSGSAGLHLAARLLGVEAGDEVICSSFTFIATATPILYQGARPIFIDAEDSSWNLDPNLLADALADRRRLGRRPRAIIVADLYGQCADWDAISRVAADFDVPVIDDAAEAVGSSYHGRAAGAFGRVGVYSFNGNKIMTTSGGGMLLSDDTALIARAAKLATQARDAAPHYQHTEWGYNYRLSNVLAGIGRGQLAVLPQRVERRRQIFAYYRDALGHLPGIDFMPEVPGTRSNRWLTCMTLDPAVITVTPGEVLAALERENIEGRPLWKPLHLQPVFAGVPTFGGAVSARLFARGLCLPSGSAMTDADLERVAGVVRSALGHE